MYEEGVEQIRIASELDDRYWSRYNNVKNAVEVIRNIIIERHNTDTFK